MDPKRSGETLNPHSKPETRNPTPDTRLQSSSVDCELARGPPTEAVGVHGACDAACAVARWVMLRQGCVCDLGKEHACCCAPCYHDHSDDDRDDSHESDLMSRCGRVPRLKRWTKLFLGRAWCHNLVGNSIPARQLHSSSARPQRRTRRRAWCLQAGSRQSRGPGRLSCAWTVTGPRASCVGPWVRASGCAQDRGRPAWCAQRAPPACGRNPHVKRPPSSSQSVGSRNNPQRLRQAESERKDKRRKDARPVG